MMKITQHSIYAIQVLFYLSSRKEGLATIEAIANSNSLSKAHVANVIWKLAAGGYVKTSRGRNGGVRLRRSSKETNLGSLVRYTEPHFNVAECFDPKTSTCPIAGFCALRRVLEDAKAKYLEELDKFYLSDLAEI